MNSNQDVGDGQALLLEKAKEITTWRFIATNVWYQAFIVLYFIIFSSSFALGGNVIRNFQFSNKNLISF